MSTLVTDFEELLHTVQRYEKCPCRSLQSCFCELDLFVFFAHHNVGVAGVDENTVVITRISTASTILAQMPLLSQYFECKESHT